MKQKKTLSSVQWLWMLGGSVLLLALMILGFNYVMDPYGAFGDRFFQWWSYNETLNPKMAKISYLEQNHQKYDSYIVGSSGSSSYPVELLNEYMDASFYNCFFYGTNIKDFEEICQYLVEHYEVKNLLLNLSMKTASQSGLETESLSRTSRQHYLVDGSNPLLFYGQYLFNTPADSLEKLNHWLSDGFLQQDYRVFQEETGSYDKSRRDAEPIGDLEEYLSRPAYSIFRNYPEESMGLPALEEAMERVERISSLCRERGVNLIVACQPNYHRAYEYYSQEDAARFRDALAQVTGYWDFTLSSVSYEPRYFYDGTHFRNSIGAMAVKRICGRESGYIPEDFGEYVPKGSRPGAPEASPAPEEEYTAQVPILMYHNVSPESTVTTEEFEEQMKALHEAGYQAVSLQDLVRYVEEGAELPEKPIGITFDDGYRGNYLYAYPVLQKYGFKASIFAIGVSIGKDTYKDTGEPMTPHFSLEEAKEMEASGLITVGSHGYNLHEVEGRDQDPIRQGALQRDGETDEEYETFLREDCRRMRELLGDSARFMAYPYNLRSEFSEVVLCEEGVQVTLGGAGVNTLVRGLPQSLRQLGRFGVTKGMSGQDLLEMLEDEKEGP